MKIPFGRGTPSKDTLIDALSSRDELLSHFKKLWYNSYISSLRESCRDLHQVNWNEKISIDDMVLVKLLNKSRPCWVLGRVLELIRGLDDKVRSVKVKRGDVLLPTTPLTISILLSSLIILISKIMIQPKLRVTLFPEILFPMLRLVMIL